MDNLFKEKLEGEFVVLRKVAVDDAEDIYLWRISQSGRYLRQPKNYSVESQIAWIKDRDNREVNYIIHDKLSMKKVGMIGIYDVNINDGVSDVGRLLLECSYLQKSNPFGLEALLLTYSYVFKEMDFRKISGVILASNVEMVKFQKFLGMQEEGYLRRHILIKDVEHDLHIMSLFKEDFLSYRNKLRFLLRPFYE